MESVPHRVPPASEVGRAGRATARIERLNAVSDRILMGRKEEYAMMRLSRLDVL